MKHLLRFTLILMLSMPTAFAADLPVNFAEPEQKARYLELIEEIRCLVCQNQSLSDSNAELAQDLRNEIIEMIEQNKTNDEIMQFLVERYGDFVLYRPPLKQSTWLLWLGPFVILIIAIIMAIVIIRKQATTIETLNTDEAQAEKDEQA